MGKIHILIVEDDPIIAADLEDRLDQMGHEIMGTVSKGEDSLSFFDQTPSPDLVLMDIQLEGNWDGIETAKRIRQKQNLPLIFLTSNSDDATFDQAKTVNPQAFLSKPFRGRDLKHAIELAIRNSVTNPTSKPTETKEENSFLMNDRLFIKVKDRMQRLFLDDILWVEADDYYCKIKTKEKEYLITKTLKKLSQELSGNTQFMRVHRSFIVNVTKIEEIGEVYVYIQKKQIPVSRTNKEELLARLKKI